MRLIDRRGRWIMTMTPLRGQTWVYRDLVAQPPPGVAVHWLHGTDNPHIPQDILAAMLRQFGAHEQAARLRGEFWGGKVTKFRVTTQVNKEELLCGGMKCPMNLLIPVFLDSGY